jgi:hypothetical protein
MAQLTLVQPSVAQPMSKPDASALGKQLGTSAAPSIKQGITSGNPSQAVPGYTGANQNQTSYFQGGMGSTVGPGAAKVAGCNNQNDLECQAVNLVAKARLTRPQFQIQTNDPLLSKARAIGANPSGQIGDIFSTYDTCKSATTTTPAVFDTQICQEFSGKKSWLMRNITTSASEVRTDSITCNAAGYYGSPHRSPRAAIAAMC